MLILNKQLLLRHARREKIDKLLYSFDVLPNLPDCWKYWWKILLPAFFIRSVCSSSLPWFASIYLLGFFRSYRFQLVLFQPEPASLKNWQCILGHERKWIISFYSFSSAVVIQSTLRKKLYIEPLGSEHIQGLSRKASENSGRYCGAAGRSQGISMCISSGSNN